MKTIVKRISIALKREQIKELEYLQKHFHETQSDIIKRGLSMFYQKILQIEEKTK